MISECCGSPPLINTDIIDGEAMCNSCREWAIFIDENEEIEEDLYDSREEM